MTSLPRWLLYLPSRLSNSTSSSPLASDGKVITTCASKALFRFLRVVSLGYTSHVVRAYLSPRAFSKSDSTALRALNKLPISFSA